jgi:hypothetical protein
MAESTSSDGKGNRVERVLDKGIVVAGEIQINLPLPRMGDAL